MRKLGWLWGTMDRWVLLPNIEVHHDNEFSYTTASTEVIFVWGKFFVSITYD